MTYCLGIRVADGLVCLADGRTTSGNQVTSAQNLSLHGSGAAQFAIMTSGLRALRDKTLAYFERDLRRNHPAGFATMLDAVSAYCHCLRAVAKEDREQLERSNLAFDLHTLIAGAQPEDADPGIFLVYPEGNWIEVDRRTPYLRSEEHTSELQSLMRISYAVFCLKKKKQDIQTNSSPYKHTQNNNHE